MHKFYFFIMGQSHDELSITSCSMKRSPWLYCDPCVAKMFKNTFLRSKFCNEVQNAVFFSLFLRKWEYLCDMGGPCGSKWMCQKHQYINTAEGVKLNRAHEDMDLHLSIKYFFRKWTKIPKSEI